MVQKPDTGFRVRIAGVREKSPGSELHKGDIGKEGVVIDWIDKENSKVWLPVIRLYDIKSTICHGDKVWWDRI